MLYLNPRGAGHDGPLPTSLYPFSFDRILLPLSCSRVLLPPDQQQAFIVGGSPELMNDFPPPQDLGLNRYRSWGETQIARCLNRYGVPFLYEYPVAVIDRGLTRLWYPDFKIRNQGILIEYFGRTGDPYYAAGMARKMAVYEANGLAAIPVTPDQFRGDWPGRLLGRIDQVLTDRMAEWQTVRSRRE